MSRLWSRFGLRTLSIMVLLLGLVGGAVLSSDRQHQQRGTDDVQTQAVQLQSDVSPQLSAAAAAEAAKLAQDKAAAAAAKAALQAKQAEAAHRERTAKQTTSRSTEPDIAAGLRPDSQVLWRLHGKPRDRLFGTPEGRVRPRPDALLGQDVDQGEQLADHRRESVLALVRHPAGPAGQQDGDLWQRLPDAIRCRRSSGACITSRAATRRPCGAWTFWQAHNWY